MCLSLSVGFLCWSLFWFALLYVLSSFAIILLRKRELVALILLSLRYIGSVNILSLSLVVPWIGLQDVIVVYSDHIPLLFRITKRKLGHKTDILLRLFYLYEYIDCAERFKET